MSRQVAVRLPDDVVVFVGRLSALAGPEQSSSHEARFEDTACRGAGLSGAGEGMRRLAVDELDGQAARAAHRADADEQLLVLVGDGVP
jgi:hypothetical protein